MRRRLLALALIALLGGACSNAGQRNPFATAPSPAGTGTSPGSPSASPTSSPTTVVPTTVTPLQSPPSPLPTVDSDQDPIVAVVQQVEPAVVNVTTNLFRQSPFGSQPGGRGVGTGFVIQSDGVIVTNFHVVEGAARITVTTSTPPIEKFAARVIGGDQDADLAVLKVNPSRQLATVPLGSSKDLLLGQRVVAVGYALALNGGPTVTSGIVSALDRTVRATDPNFQPRGQRTYTHVIQTDAAINPGNSGGPLLNLGGQVVGINAAGAQQAENIGFAISIDSVKSTIDHAVSDPKAPVAFLGVSTADVTPQLVANANLAVDQGAFVVSVAPKGPADQVGIRSGDVIVAFDGKPVTDSQGLGELIHDHQPGEKADVTVVELSGTRRTVTATLTVNPQPLTG
jgi:serine protease Do